MHWLVNQKVKDAYALPTIEERIDSLAGSKYFRKLDLRSGYWQVGIKETEKQKTAFSVSSLGFFECDCMVFGLINAPATFRGLWNRHEVELYYIPIPCDKELIQEKRYVEKLNLKKI